MRLFDDIRGSAKRVEAGFTLMEMLIVVAIIAILVAIAIPIFTSSLENSRIATCQANQRSMKAAVATAYMTNGGNAKDAVKTAVQTMGLEESVATGNSSPYQVSAGSLCPAGGTYTVTIAEGSVSVSCSVPSHNGADQSGSIKAASAWAAIIQTLDGGNWQPSDTTSNNPNASSETIKEYLKSRGIEFGDDDTFGYLYRPTSEWGSKFYWTTQPTNSTKLYAMAYSTKTGNYTVYEVSHKDGTLTEGKQVQASKELEDGSRQTYENALKIYNDCIAS